VAGSISVAELDELRSQTATIADARRQLDLQRRVLTMAENGRRNLIAAYVRKYHPEPSDDEFSINEQTGEILRFRRPE
jgi:hypothetical protein